MTVQQPSGITVVSAEALTGRQLRYYDYAMAAFVVILICSNLIGAGKQAAITLPFALPLIGNQMIFGAGILFFPLGYVLGDVLTEVYGYARARRVVWVGFAASVFTALMSWVVVHIPAAPGYTGQQALTDVFDPAPRIFAASIMAFWAGELANSFVLARMKVLTEGRALWTRLIGSTVVGQGVDSLIFYPLAFIGAKDWPADRILQVMLTNYALKAGWEILLVPVTYRIVAAFKRAEGVDVFDRGTDFSPFKAAV